MNKCYSAIAVLGVLLCLVRPVEAKEPPPRNLASGPDHAIALSSPSYPSVEILHTQSCQVHFSPMGGVPVKWDIIDSSFVASRNEGAKRIALIDEGLSSLGLGRPLEILLDTADGKSYESINQTIFAVSRTEDNESITLRFESAPIESDLKVIKTYRFERQGFMAKVFLTLVNVGQLELRFDQDGRGLGIALGPGFGAVSRLSQGEKGRHSYPLPFYKSSDGVSSIRLNLEESSKEFTRPNAGIEWAGLHSQYFFMALIPDPASASGRGFNAGLAQLPSLQTHPRIAKKNLRNYPRVELYGAPFSISPGQSAEFSYILFSGPKDRRILCESHLDLDSILFHNLWNWMRVLCLILMSILNGFHSLLGNWGVSIIALAIAVRIVSFPITRLGLIHQVKMREVQAKLKPHLNEIKKKYKDNADRRNEEIFKLYRKHGFNPLGAFKGFLWILIQLPIFIGLYQVISQSVDLHGVGFLWIKDLSQPDRLFPLGFSLPFFGGYFNLLPFVMAGVQIMVGRSMGSSDNPEPGQNAMHKAMTYIMPLAMLILFYTFSSGCVLYWTMVNVCQVFEQRLARKKLTVSENKEAKKQE